MFVCLSSTEQDYTPDGQERAELQLPGLGQKRVTLSAYGDLLMTFIMSFMLSTQNFTNQEGSSCLGC